MIGIRVILATGVGALVAVPALGQDRAARTGAAPQVVQSTEKRFKDRVAEIVAAKDEMRGQAWSEIDRERLADHFRLSRGRPEAEEDAVEPSGLLPASLAEAVMMRGASYRGVQFGIDGGPPRQGPAEQAHARVAQIAERGMARAATCAGRMPALACSADGDSDSGLRLALAYRF